MPKGTINPINLQAKYNPIKHMYVHGSINLNTTIVMTWIPLTPQVQYQPLFKLPVMTHTTPSVLKGLMETQCNHSQYPILMENNCPHNPSTIHVSRRYHPNPVSFPYPPDPGEHVLETPSTPTTLVERDKHDLSSQTPPNREMEISFSWTCPFKSPTSSTLYFGEPTRGKLNQETDFHVTKHM